MSENKSFIQRAIGDMKEGASEQHRIDRENFAAVKADSKARFEEAKKPTPDFEEFAQAKGLKAKLQVLLDQAVRNGKEMRQEERIQYEAMLKEMRENINNLTVDR